MSDATTVENPFASSPVTVPRPGVMLGVAQQREVAEVQAMMIIARSNPRDERKAMDDILLACMRPSLAETALYEYSRGGTAISGPSIRLAETIAQKWGNIDFGVRELEQRDGESTVEAFAWDMQTGVRSRKVFQVRHEYMSKGTKKQLSDPRDIYELTANQGARRVRNCILSLIDGDIVEAACRQVEITLRTKADVTPDNIAAMVAAFADLGVSREQLQKRAQRNLETISPAQLIALRKIYNSLRDGMSAPGDWFPPAETAPVSPPNAPQAAPAAELATRTAAVREALRGRGRKPAPPPETAPLSGQAPSEILREIMDLANTAKDLVDLDVPYDLARSLAPDEALEATRVLQIARDRLELGQ